jgi:hypothetical protein
LPRPVKHLALEFGLSPRLRVKEGVCHAESVGQLGPFGQRFKVDCWNGILAEPETLRREKNASRMRLFYASGDGDTAPLARYCVPP